MIMKHTKLTEMNWGLAVDREHHFRLSYYPHRLKEFTVLLQELFGKNAQHAVFGDFKPLGKIKAPAYYIHVIQKK